MTDGGEVSPGADDGPTELAEQAAPVARHASAGARRERQTGRRPRQVNLRLTDEELAWLTRCAASAGSSVPRFLFESARAVMAAAAAPTMSGAQPARAVVTASQQREALAQLLGMRRLLSNIANNVNQIAVAANSGAVVSSARLDGTVDALHTWIARLREIVDDAVLAL